MCADTHVSTNQETSSFKKAFWEMQDNITDRWDLTASADFSTSFQYLILFTVFKFEFFSYKEEKSFTSQRFKHHPLLFIFRPYSPVWAICKSFLVKRFSAVWEATAVNLLWRSLDSFQEQTKDEDKRPDGRAVLVNARDKGWRSSSLQDERRLENHP